MKNLIYFENNVTAYQDAIEGEKIFPGAQSLFVGTEKQCRKKVQELGLDYGDFDLAPIIIPPCTPRQIRLWLLSLGVTNNMIIAQINTIQDEQLREATLIEYEYASSFDRNHAFVDVIGASLGLTAEQIDEGFLYASTI